MSPFSDGNQQSTDAHENRRARLYNTRGVVLRRRDIGESDRVIVVYTSEFGKRSFSARGSRKTTSKIAGQIEPFSLVRLYIAQTRGLHIVSQAEALNVFAMMRNDERRIATAGLFVDLLDSMTPEDQPNRDLLDLLIASLTLLDDGFDTGLVLVAYQLGLFRHLGYRPELAHCSMCSRELTPDGNGFNLESGVVCPACVRLAPHVVDATINALKLMRTIDRGDLGVLLNMKLDPAIIAEADQILAAYSQNITGKPSRAREVYRDLRLQ